ncbi:hypothetical protein EYF80_037763 [Liparis tanakae]|uniref:Uncharacterized protein n=1 Tax=Liparis tanakae TaxID=230148 RepID=A0A4Z2GER8_9TELE|nr:hypothetical protein EYF80_037763 [Liparis tanakae]
MQLRQKVWPHGVVTGSKNNLRGGGEEGRVTRAAGRKAPSRPSLSVSPRPPPGPFRYSDATFMMEDTSSGTSMPSASRT